MKIKKTVLLLFVISSLVSCKTKIVKKEVVVLKKETNYIPYYLKVYEADSLYQIREYQKSYTILDNLFKKYEPLQMENYNEYGVYIICSILTGNTKDINEKIRKCYSNFGNLSFFHRDSDKFYDILFKTTIISAEDIDGFIKEYSKKINLNLRGKIKIMLEEDQSVRMDSYNELGIKRVQEKHKIEIDEIIGKYGYPNYQIIGHAGYEAINGPIMFEIVFTHQDKKVKDKYLPMMLENLKKGKCLPAEYASIYDKSLLQKTSEMKEPKQLYGTFPDIPLFNLGKIDSLRESIGLPRYGYDKWVDKLLNP